MNTKIYDMPKLESPFVRDEKTHIVTPAIAEGYEWVFEDSNVLATEKLDGTNVSIIIKNGIVESVFNRTNRIQFINKNQSHIIEGLLNSYKKDYINLLWDGQHFGELIGEKVNGNPLNIKGHLWIPFETYAQEHLVYKSWNKYPKTYESISNWFENDLFSLFRRGRTGEVEPAEGIVFVQPSTNKMAKLRRDMFLWYKGKRH